MDYCPDIALYLRNEIDVLKALDIKNINLAMNLLDEAFENGKNVYVFGNGGSASTASHFQNDFNKGISEHTTKKFYFQCLNDNIATVMAIANDIGYDDVFRFQLEGRLKEGDLIIAISGSGNSPNIIRAVEYAHSLGNKVIGLTGYDGGKLQKISDCSLHAPINSMQITEDIHMIFNHLIMSIYYQTKCGIKHIKE